MTGDRVTTVRLVARVNEYLDGLEAAEKKTKELAAAAKELADRKQGIADLGAGLLAIGTVAAVGIALAVTKFAEFDQSISNVKAATQESAENMGLLRQAALEAGAETVFSATEAAGAIEELGKAGLTTAEILDGGLNGALALAAAGGLGVAEAASITAISLKQFGLDGDRASHVADLLAAGAGKAVGDVTDLGAALGQSGLVASQVGLTIEETTGTLAAFADAGLLGSDAGTSLKSALQRLTPQSKEAEGEMKRLGISAYDAGGNFIGVSAFAGNLQDSLKGLTDEQRNTSLAIIFGSDAVRGASVLYEEGAAGIQKYIDQTNDAGYAARVSADRLNNLKGDIEQLGGAFDTALIQSGSGANDVLRDLVQGATGLINVIGGLPAPALATGLALTGVVAAAGLVGGGALIALPKVLAFKAGLDTLGLSGKTAALGLGAATLGLTAVTLALGAIAASQAKAENTSKSFQDSLDQATGAVTSYTRELVVKELQERGAFDGAKRAGVTQRELTDAIIQGGDALAEVNKKIRDSGTFFDTGKGNTLNATRELRNGLDDAATGFDNMKEAADKSQSGTDDVASGLADLKGAAADASTEIDDLKAAIEGFGSAQLDVNSASREFESAIDAITSSVQGATDAVDDNNLSLDVGTQAGRQNLAALDGLAQGALGLASATLTQTGSQDAAAAAIQRGRDELIKALGQFGITGQAAEDYANNLGLIPGNVQTAVKLTGVEAAQEKLDNFFRTNNNRQLTTIQYLETRAPLGGVPTPRLASGGAVSGPGSGTSDSVPALLSNGEHVLTSAEVRAMGGQAGVYAFRRNLGAVYSPTPGRYANGGAVNGGPSVVNNNTFTAPAIETKDPLVYAQIIGRDFARRLAG